MRDEGERGFCGTPSGALVASWGLHFGEERVLVGQGGSGTIFLAGCNLKCVFCQNWDISHSTAGREASAETISRIMLDLEARGAVNANFVTPTHHAPQVAEAVSLAREGGFRAPVVYNCGGYEGIEALERLEGIVDIYMPDVKFLDSQASSMYLQARDYPERVRAALVEMHRQVGDLAAAGGVAQRGLLVRHLVMPGCVEDSRAIMDFLAGQISPDTFVNVMGQYRPLFRAAEFAGISRRPEADQVREVRRYAEEKGLRLAR